VGGLDGRLLIGPRRLIGRSAASARESVYAVLIDRSSESAYVCWICGEVRADRGLVRALDHVRGHFNLAVWRPIFISVFSSASPPPLASIW
jgi:hypothetical protein